MSQCKPHTLDMTSYVIHIWCAAGVTRGKCFTACTPHLGEFPLYFLYSNHSSVLLQVSIQQVYTFPVCHGNNID